MRILFCNFEYPPLGGGGGVVNALLAQELAKRHEVTVLTSRGLGLAARSTENAVRVVRAPVLFRREEAVASLASMASFLLAGIGTGKALLRQTRYDVINTHFVLPTGPVGDALARAGRLPHVLTLHGGDLYDPSKATSPHKHPFLRAWVRRLLRRADAVVGQSRNTLANMQRFYAPEIEGIRIPLGIERPVAPPGARRDHGVEEDDVLLLTIGRLVARKAIHQLLRVLEGLRGERTRLIVVGSGPLEEELRVAARGAGLADRVVFTGKVEEREKQAILGMCDVFVSTSQHEGFGLVFLEAMASALPIVCYDEGGQTDFLQDGVTGYLPRLNDLDGFTSRVRQLVCDPARRKEMGGENLRRVESYFIDNCALRYETLFDSLIAKARGN